MHKLLKTGLAASAAAATLFLTALPSAATADNFLSVTGGTIETSVADFPLAGGGGTTCTNPAGTYEINVASLAGGSHATVVESLSDVSYFTLNGQNYQIVQGLGLGDQTGTVAGTTVSQNLSVSVDIYETTTPTGCTPGTQECDMDVDFTLSGSASAAPDANGDYDTGDTVTLDGPGTQIVNDFCNSPFDALGTIEFDGLQLTVQ